jgi:hypothetical protein
VWSRATADGDGDGDGDRDGDHDREGDGLRAPGKDFQEKGRDVSICWLLVRHHRGARSAGRVVWSSGTPNFDKRRTTMGPLGNLQAGESANSSSRSARPRPARRILRRIGAVLAGVLAVFVLSLGTDVVMHALNVFPPWGQPMSDVLFLLATAYRIPYGIAGGYVAAQLAPDRPMHHALALGAVGFALSTAGAVAAWDLGPAWYPLALIATALPCAWAGGRLHILRAPHAAPPGPAEQHA